MSNGQLAERAPAILTNTPINGVSDNYSFIPSTKVIEDIRQLGWHPVSAEQRQSRLSSTKEYGQHIIKFEKQDGLIKLNGVDKVKPQVIFMNSHDAKSSFRFYAGLFRLVCSNGLVIPVKDYKGDALGGGIRIRHINYTMEQLSQDISGIVEEIRKNLDPIETLGGRKMTASEMETFVREGLLIKHGISEKMRSEFLSTITDETLDLVLTPQRDEDVSTDAWSVFNVVQENLTKGNYTLKATNSVGKRKQSPLKDVLKNNEFNLNLYEAMSNLVLN